MVKLLTQRVALLDVSGLLLRLFIHKKFLYLLPQVTWHLSNKLVQGVSLSVVIHSHHSQ